MAVSIKPAVSSLEVGAPVPLFKLRVPNIAGRNYSVSADGRFLVSVVAENQSATPITVILNWAAGMKK